ncbi:MAG: RluA family pseudouridine synthase [Planctomycetota bacterium]
MSSGEIARQEVLQAMPDVMGMRLDAFLAETFPGNTRSFFKKRILEGLVQVNGRLVKPGYFLRGNEQILVNFLEPPASVAPVEIPFEVLFEDDVLAVINKPPRIAVHPVPGQRTPTLVNALMHRFDSLSDVAGKDRPGLVHRLDRDTSGVLLIAKTNRAHLRLKDQFKSRTVEKEYQTLVRGVMPFDSEYIDAPIARDPHRHDRMMVHFTGRKALTFYEVIHRYPRHTHVRCRIFTGRTHQIRLHLSHLGYPVVGDPLYGRGGEVERTFLPSGEELPIRLFLHAYRLQFTHPTSERRLEFCSELPDDLARIIRYAEALS